MCISDRFSICTPETDREMVARLALEILDSLDASPYDIIGVAAAFGANVAELKKRLGTEASGHVKKPVATFLYSYGRVHGYQKVERELLKLYQASRGTCLCPVGPLAPLEGGGYIVQRPSGIYICREECREVGEPLALYEHPQGCMFYSPPLVLDGQPISAVAAALRQLKVLEPELVARYLLPGLCRDLWGVYI
ncbi:MAG: hypothetical protein ACK4M3_02215 [Pyrobaculum sp.]